MQKLNQIQRDAIRAIVRKHSGFDAFRAANGNFASRDLNGQLLRKAIYEMGLRDEVTKVLGLANIKESTVDELNALDSAITNMESDTWLAGPAGTGMVTSPIDMAETVLSPLRPFLSASLLSTVTDALAPIVMLANKPAVEIERTVTVDRIVTVDSNGATVAPPFVPAMRVGASTIGKLFGVSGRVKHADKPISVWQSSDSVPDIDPFHVPDVLTLSKLVSAIDPALPRVPRNVWLAGPAGTGKSTLPEQIAARAGRSFTAITFQRATEPADIIGGNGLVSGATVWVDGVLTRAIRRPGMIILLDEITLAPPGIAAMLQTLLSSRAVTLPTGEVVCCAEGVCFVCADNTRGFGDESGLYAGTHQANAALVDRMARLIVVDYLDPALEAEALANRTFAPMAACKRVVAFVNLARKLPGFENVPLSLRRQIAFVEMSIDGYTINEAFEDCVLSRLPDAERATIHAAFKVEFQQAAFKAELDGQMAPVVSATVTGFDAVEVQ